MYLLVAELFLNCSFEYSSLKCELDLQVYDKLETITGTATSIGLTMKQIDRISLREDLCVRKGSNSSFEVKFGTGYTLNNCELFITQTQSTNWQVRVILSDTSDQHAQISVQT